MSVNVPLCHLGCQIWHALHTIGASRRIALLKPLSSEAGEGSVTSADLRGDGGDWGRRDWDATTEPEAAEPGRNVEVVADR